MQARKLQRGSHVMAADGITTLEVIKVMVHKSRELLYLEAGEAKLTVTGNHRMLAPQVNMVSTDAVRDVNAAVLQVGDFIICKTQDGSIPRQLTDVCLITFEEGAEEDVIEITFNPDEPVAVFQEPSSVLLSKGVKKKHMRRGLRKNRGHGETSSMPDTVAGEYSD